MLTAHAGERLGGHVVAEGLRALGADVVFGLPGVHALPIWEGLEACGLRGLALRQEVNAGFAADGCARVTGRPTALVVSTGPGALMALAPVMEAATAHVPLVVVSSQIAADAIGRGLGHLHELPDQRASFAPLVKWCGRAASVEAIPGVLAEAWRRAGSAPQGPVYVEVPFDVLEAVATIPAVVVLDGAPPPPVVPPAELLDRAAELLTAAKRPLLWAGGGVLRAGAWVELGELAARLDAPVATTYTGRGAFPDGDPLALGSGWDEPAHRKEVATADVVLCVGSALGYELTDNYRLRLRGTLIHVDAAPNRIGLHTAALPLVGDARATLLALLERLPAAGPPREGQARARAVRARIADGLAAQPRSVELGLLRAVEEALPAGAVQAWDSTILAYLAIAHLRGAEPRRFLFPAGSSTLGYAWPAALGACAALASVPTLAVVGDGGIQYGLSELATARQHGLDTVLLVVDDGGYGILREYQDAAGFVHAAVDLEQPDLVAVCDAVRVPARRSAPERLADDLRWALGLDGPAAVILPIRLAMTQPTP